MKNTNKFLILLLVAFMAMPVMNSCTKKGDDDPGLSLKSRKSRLTGEWNLQSGTETFVSGGNSVNVTYNGTTATASTGGQTITVSYTEKSEFKKDNTFITTIMNDGNITINEGFWAFMDGYDDMKDQECIVLRTSKTTNPQGVTIYTGDKMPSTVMRFRRLSNKEAIIDSDGTQTSGGSTVTTTSTKTYTKK